MRLCLFGIIILTLMAGCSVYANEEEDFTAAKQQNTVEIWQAFIKNYPNGRNSVAAREAHDDLLYKKSVSASSDPQVLEIIFKQCKTSSIADKVFKLWDEASWIQAQRQKTTKAYHDYILHFPGGTYIKKANEEIEDITWNNCLKSGTVEVYEQYLKEYPYGKYAEKARKDLGEVAYREAKEKDTIEAYEKLLGSNYYSNEEAGKRLRQLRYEKAVKNNSLEDWLDFLEEYQYMYWGDNDEETADQMMKNANQEVERLIYENIISHPTLQLCRDYMNRCGNNSPHIQQVIIKMEPCLFEEAVKTNNADLYLEYLGRYKTGYKADEIKQHLDALVFAKLNDNETFSVFERYLELCFEDRDNLITRMEPFMFDWAKKVNTIEAYEKYLFRYPEGSHVPEVQAFLEPLLFKKAEQDNWHSSYEAYLEKFPNGANAEKAKKQLEWLRSNTAVVEIDYPKVIEQPGGRWSWVTKFRETGGKIGFKISGSGYICDASGGRWGTYGSYIGRNEIVVKPGGTGSDNYWCDGGESHTFCNGKAFFEWRGEDAGGHLIYFVEEVEFKHNGCPGYTGK